MNRCNEAINSRVLWTIYLLVKLQSGARVLMEDEPAPEGGRLDAPDHSEIAAVTNVGGLYFVRCVPADLMSLRLAFTYPEIFLPHHGYADKPGCKVVGVTVDGLVQIDGAKHLAVVSDLFSSI